MSAAGTLRRALWHLRHGGLDGLRTFRRRLRAERGPRAEGVARVRADRRGRRTVSFEPWPLPEAPRRRSGLRVGVILDDFSRLAFSYEWDQVALTRAGWREELERRPIELLFVESAWHGNSDEWQYQLTGTRGPREEFRALVAWCREQGIPTVFWNKEDPTHHEDFLEAARLFDTVFTTDGNLLAQYREELGHDRVGVLPFAAQSAIHNPCRPPRGYQARDIAFAGMYFAHRHPERREQMDLLLGAALEVSPRMEHGLEIFSRLLGGDPRYQFPAPLDSRVVGSLAYEQMLTAYRAYKVFLNVNTVTDSPTMCARRIFEITACGTPVVSTPSPAISAIFPPDEVVQVADSRDAGWELRALVRSPELRDRMVHSAQRRIWAAHTYSHRVDDVLQRAGLGEHVHGRRMPRVTALVSSIRPQQLGHVIDQLAGQCGVEIQLAFLAHGWDVDENDLRARCRDGGIEDVVVLGAGREVPLGACLNRLVDAADGEIVAKIDDDDLYGSNYLRDQVDALEYSGADVVGKQAHYVHLAGRDLIALRFPEREHRFTDFVMGPTITASRDTARSARFLEVARGEDTGFLRAVTEAGGAIYSSDRFGFAQVRGGATHTWDALDSEILASSTVVGSGAPGTMVII